MNKDYIISGIQQMGIGVANAEEAWAWYRKHFGFDVPIFKDAATATLMTRYTSGKAESRYAILAMNMQGGGGFEIWQYTSKQPLKPTFSAVLGDTGIYIAKLKSRDVRKSFDDLKSKGATVLSKEPVTMPDGRLHFYVRDPYGNIFEVVESSNWFRDEKKTMGGVAGCVIGVSDMDKALPIYASILEHHEVVYDVTQTFSDFAGLPNGNDTFRRVLIRPKGEAFGAFSRLLGSTEIELVQSKTIKPRKIFDSRNWGDLGFIHLCFDIRGMKSLGEYCAAQGFPFTVDSANSFDMGKAAGHFTYIEDPDGTLIEFVETHKIPIFEKIGWYLNLKNRDPKKPLPNWMLGMLSLNRVKD